MTHPKDPPRLVDPASGAPETVRAVLRAGKSELPDAAQIARLAARLPLGSPPAGGSPAAGAAGAAGGSLIPSALTGAALAVVVVIGYAWRERSAQIPVLPAIVAGAESGGQPLPSSPPIAQTPAPEAHPAAPRATAPATATMTPAPPPPPIAAPVATSTVADAALTVGDAPAGSVAPSDGESEAHLLSRAQDALASDPTRALAIADEHARRFPGGALAQERELLAVAALVRVGRQGEARDRATRFLSAFPRSAHRRRIEALVGIESLQKNEPVAPPTP